MSVFGQKQTLGHVRVMSALPPKADIGTYSWDVCFVPKADILRCSKKCRYSITLRSKQPPPKAALLPPPQQHSPEELKKPFAFPRRNLR
jgi:hypothetical protein